METPKGGGGKSINVTAPQTLERLRQLPRLQDAPRRRDRLLQGRALDRHVRRPREHRRHLRRRRAPAQQRHDPVQAADLGPRQRQVHRFAFQTTRAGLKRIVCGHKANIMKMTDGLFLDRFRAPPGLPRDRPRDIIVDALCMNLVVKPEQFQMIVLPNLMGDIVSDPRAGLVGGLASRPAPTSGATSRSSRRCTAPRPTSPARASRTRRRSSSRRLMMLPRRPARGRRHIENALLATLESGSTPETSAGTPAKPPSAPASSPAIIDRLGQSPKTVTPIAVPEQDRASSSRPPAPRGPKSSARTRTS